ncbi:unnamed protein product, partial [Ectocarpus sp. 12 AP-2014]
MLSREHTARTHDDKHAGLAAVPRRQNSKYNVGSRGKIFRTKHGASSLFGPCARRIEHPSRNRQLRKTQRKGAGGEHPRQPSTLSQWSHSSAYTPKTRKRNRRMQQGVYTSGRAGIRVNPSHHNGGD